MSGLTWLGWLLGVVIGAVIASGTILALGFMVIPFLALPAGIIGPLLLGMAAWVVLLIALSLLILAFWGAYSLATAALAPFRNSLSPTPIPGLVQSTPSPVTVPNVPGELFARGLAIGLAAAVNFVVWSAVPGGLVIAIYAFIVVSLAAIRVIAASRIYQGFLGWSSWVLPLSYVATAVGLGLFLASLVAVLFLPTLVYTVRLDWTTGVIETTGGLAGITGHTGGFSLGNFTYIVGGVPGGLFTVPSTSSHETGHSLNTAAFGGIVLWINAIDENIIPARMNLAYGELAAQGHSNVMPGAPDNDFALSFWF